MTTVWLRPTTERFGVNPNAVVKNCFNRKGSTILRGDVVQVDLGAIIVATNYEISDELGAYAGVTTPFNVRVGVFLLALEDVAPGMLGKFLLHGPAEIARTINTTVGGPPYTASVSMAPVVGQDTLQAPVPTTRVPVRCITQQGAATSGVESIRVFFDGTGSLGIG